MVSEFNSVKVPFVIMISVVLSLIGVLFGLAMYYLMGVHGATANPSREMQTINSDGIAFMLTPWRHVQNWRFAIYPIGLVSFFGTVVAGVVATIWNRRQGRWTLDWQRIAMFALFSFAGITLTSSFTVSRLEAGKIRHVLPISVALIPLWAALLVQIISLVPAVLLRGIASYAALRIDESNKLLSQTFE